MTCFRSLFFRLLFLLCLLPGFGWAGSPSRTFDASSEDGSGSRQENENDPVFYLQLIASMQEKNLYFASMAHLDAFDRRWPNDTRAALLRADALRETAYTERAKAIYRNLLKSEQPAGAYHGLGIIAGRQGDRRAALEALLKGNELAPTHVAILNDLGYIQLLEGRLEDARLSLHKAGELDQKNVRVGANLALLYLLDKKAERAAGIMNWYQLPESHREEIYRKAERLARGLEDGPLQPAKPVVLEKKLDKVEGVSQGFWE